MSVKEASKAVEKAKSQAPATVTVENTVQSMIERQKGEIARALPRLMDPDRFARILVTECKANRQLLKCEPLSLMAAVMKAASLGVEPGPLGHSYLVPFRNKKTNRTEVQFILGYKGVIDLARRSGKVSSIYAEVVYDGDEFDYCLGLKRDLTHKRSPDADRSHITHAYAVAHYVDGGYDFVVLDEFDIDARRNRSQAKDSGPWKTDRPAMSKKSAIHALKPFLPLTVEAAIAIASDERTFDFGDDGDVIDIPSFDDDEPSNPDAIAADAAEAPSDAADSADDDPGRPFVEGEK
jgi:recombination protein RecT